MSDRQDGPSSRHRSPLILWATVAATLGSLIPGCVRAQTDEIPSAAAAVAPRTAATAATGASDTLRNGGGAADTVPGRRALLDSAAADSASSPASAPRIGSPHTDKTFFTRRDLVYTGVALAVSGGLMPFDVRVAHWTQEPHVQGSGTLHNAVNTLTRINETPLTIASVVTYGLGRAFHSDGVADVGLHWTESIALTDAICEAIRSPLGRARPRESQTNQYNFDFLAGFTKFQNRSFPSIHSAVAFATASALVGEIQDRHPGAVWYAAPLLFSAALVPPLTRLYLNQHWMSDVVSGAFVGTLIGSKVVSYAHTHNRNKLDRFLLGLNAVPSANGVLVYKTITR